MAESKNNFIKAKMNQDLDDRLVPKGEYRVGQNVTISRSEGDDVGTFQNVLGNNQLSDFGLTDPGLEVIGYLVEEVNDRLYFFATNYSDSSIDQISNPAPTASANYIVRYDFNTNTSVVLVQGSFLNFSKTHRIYGVNIVENLLFWTDNRNQPRKINVDLAFSIISYYNSEDKVSVAKFFPSNPLNFYKEIRLKATNSGTNTTSLILGVKSSAAAEGLFVGMPVSLGSPIGINIYLTTVSSIDGSVTLSSNASWSANDVIVFSEYGLKNCSDPYLPNIYEGTLTALNTGVSNGFFNIEKVTLNSTIVNPILEGVNSVYANSELNIATSGPGDPIMTVEQGYKIVQYDTSTATPFIKVQTASGTFPDAASVGRVKIYRSNPDYDVNFAGDSEFLKDKFVRFSYRYKFDDNEYSLIAPFTQIAFTPKQFGSFVLNDEELAGKSSVLNFFENNIDCVDLYIRTPFESTNIAEGVYSSWTTTLNSLNIKEIEILCKFANESVIKVIDVLDSAFINDISENGTSSYIKYSYKSTKPIRVLPEKDITRVFDKAPIKALAQEVSGNRVMYGNYLDKHTSPLSLEYKLAVVNKIDLPLSQDKRVFLTHSLKENRTYQVGIVLADRYGRQSDVILSSIQNAQDISGSLFGASTIYNSYSNSNSFSASSLLNFTGKQLLLYLETAIPQTIPQKGYPGLYSQSNPLGWYTYKIVVKQQEQEYYNVYAPGSIRLDVANYDFLNSYISLVNDNINKIPKDLTNVGPEEKEFRSSVSLFPKVNPTFKIVDAASKFNSFFTGPSRKSDEVSSIIYNAVDTSTSSSESSVGREVDTDKVFKGNVAALANVVNNQLFGTLASQVGAGGNSITWNKLAVYETNPFVSNLDIYYETSTSGFISELNNAIETGTIGPVSITTDNLEFYENTETYFKGTGTVSQPEKGTIIYTIEMKDSNGVAILSAANACSISSVTSSLTGATNRSSLFTIVPQVSGSPAAATGRFDIYANDYVYYDTGQIWTFNLSVTANSIANTLSFSGAMSNIQPQYNQQGNVGETQLGNSFIPLSEEPYKNYTRQTSTGLSLKPNDYTAPNQGDNNATQGLAGIQNKAQTLPAEGFIGGSMPFLYFMNGNAPSLQNAPSGLSFIPASYFISNGTAPGPNNTSVPYNKNVDWKLTSNNSNGTSQPASSTGTNSYCPYVGNAGGVNDWNFITKSPSNARSLNDTLNQALRINKNSSIYWWRNLMYNNGTTRGFNNYPTEFRGFNGVAQGATSGFPGKTTFGLPTIQMNETGKFYSLIGYNSSTLTPGVDAGPFNVLEKNEDVSRFITNNGGTGFLNGTLDTSRYQLDLSYSLTDLHFPTGDILADPFNPTGRFDDTSGEISSRLSECVTVNNSGEINILDTLFHSYFGYLGSKTNLIPDTSGWSDCGIIINDKLGHEKLFQIQLTATNSIPGGTPATLSWNQSTGSYGMFWIGFTLNVTDAGGGETNVPINLLIIT